MRKRPGVSVKELGSRRSNRKRRGVAGLERATALPSMVAQPDDSARGIHREYVD